MTERAERAERENRVLARMVDLMSDKAAVCTWEGHDFECCDCEKSCPACWLDYYRAEAEAELGKEPKDA